ncbi:uncharacterized protein [Pyrus communis]|uniref:uncharacterized protein n=1 Tax=Pyrus communis TaxID=23211 RepID=UPI0035C0E9D5
MTCDIEVLALIDEMGKNRMTELFVVDKKKKDVGEGSTNVDASVEQEVEMANKGDVVSFLEDVEGGNGEDADVEGEKNEEVVDEDVFKDSDYEQDSDIELQVDYEVDDDEFEEHVDQPIIEEPEEMGFAREISDEDANSCDFHSLENETSQEKDEFDEVTSRKRKRQWNKASTIV